jgi:2-haloacid dehalogenase
VPAADRPPLPPPGSPRSAGRRWRGEYLRLAYTADGYLPYEDLVLQAGRPHGIGPGPAEALIARWDELAPWPEAPRVVAEAARTVKLGVVTNCSEDLGRRAARRVGVPFDVVVVAEAAGAYKPRPESYRMALDALGVPAGRVLFVAGSRYDIPGASGVGMPV